MCGVPGAKIGHSQLCFVVIHNVIIIIGQESERKKPNMGGFEMAFLT
jgi:hypothetical protein